MLEEDGNGSILRKGDAGKWLNRAISVFTGSAKVHKKERYNLCKMIDIYSG